MATKTKSSTKKANKKTSKLDEIDESISEFENEFDTSVDEEFNELNIIELYAAETFLTEGKGHYGPAVVVRMLAQRTKYQA